MAYNYNPTFANNAVPVTAYSTSYGPSSGLRFPFDLEKQPYWISFSFYQYQMPDLIQQNVYYRDTGTIRLPLPNSMVDSQHVNYAAESLNLTGAAAIAASKAAGGGLRGVAAGIAAGTAVGAGANLLGSGLAATATSAVGPAVLQNEGVAINPFLSVMFKSPAFKQHSLSWKLAPSNQKESQNLNAIINTFRMNMLPNQSGALAGTLLTYPNIVQATISVNSDTYFSYRFKPAVVQNFDVNFAPGGQPSFFGSNKAPTEVEIRLQMTEIEYWLASDYGLADSSYFGAGFRSDAEVNPNVPPTPGPGSSGAGPGGNIPGSTAPPGTTFGGV